MTEITAVLEKLRKRVYPIDGRFEFTPIAGDILAEWHDEVIEECQTFIVTLSKAHSNPHIRGDYELCAKHLSQLKSKGD